MAKVLSRNYIANVLLDIHAQACDVRDMHIAAVGSSVFSPVVTDIVAMLDIVAAKVVAKKKLGNDSRKVLLDKLKKVHAVFKDTAKITLRADAHNVCEHSLFRLVQRLDADVAVIGRGR